MRVGVTGSTGFIGSALVSALRELDDDVVTFVRPQSSGHDAHAIRWDPASGHVDEDDLRRVGGFDAVVNLAGAGIADRRWTRERKTDLVRSRIESTSLLVRALSQMSDGTPMLASASAIGYYGSCGDEVLDEGSSYGDDFLADLCVQWEGATAPLGRAGTTIAHLRTGIVMSRAGGALKKQLPLYRYGFGGVLGSGRQWLSPISLHDEIRAILFVLEHRLSGPVNLVAPEALTNRVFTKELGRALHRPTVATVPEFALKLALGSQLASVAVLASQRVVPKVLLENGFTYHHPDARTILSAVLSKAG